MHFESVRLPDYTKGEEIFNSVSHGIGVLFGVLSFAVLFFKAATPGAHIGAAIFGVSMIVLYLASTVYHAVRPSYIKKIMRVVDHAVIYILIAGTSIPIMIIGVLPYNRPFAVVMIALSLAIGVAGTVLTYIDQERFKAVQTVLYMVLGWMCLALIYPLYKYCENSIQLIIAIVAGGIVYTVGTTFLALGRTKRYFHGIFHLFVLVGSLIHFIGLYFFLF